MLPLVAFRTGRSLHRSRSGWTKLQIVGMIAILVAGFFVLRPVFREAGDINQLSAVGKSLGNNLLEPRIRAKDESRIYACYVKPGTGEYQIGEWTGRTPDGKQQAGVKLPKFAKPQNVKQHVLPAGITFVTVDVTLDERATEIGLQRDLSRRPTQQWSLPILFYPDETNLRAKFVLSFQDQYFVNVMLDPATGESTVGPAYEVETPIDNKEPYDPLKEARDDWPK